MKYVIGIMLTVIIFVLILPILLIKWDDNGFDDIVDGIRKLCDID
jgi:hypothetical protein